MKNKVVVVGTGFVGSSYAYSLVNQGVVDELVLVDINKANTIANSDDLVQCVCYLDNQPKIKSGDYSDCKDADIVCITAGANQKPGQSRLELVGINAKIMESIVKEIMASGFDGILLIASNPVDVMTQVAQKVSGLDESRVIGSGTTLDSGRLRHFVGEYLDVNPKDVHAYIIGEHGDSSVPIWSHSYVGTKPILDIIKENNNLTQEGLDECFIKARDAAYRIIEGKGATYYGIGICLTEITKAILRNKNIILPCGAKLNGEYNQKDLYIAVPCVVGREGVKEIQQLNITSEEQEKFNNSCEQLRKTLKEIGY